MADTIPAYTALLDSWELTLEAENKTPRTIGNDREALDLFVRWLTDQGLTPVRMTRRSPSCA